MLVVCAVGYPLIERGKPKVPEGLKVTPTPTPASTPTSPTPTFNLFGPANSIRDAVAAVDRIVNAKAEFEAANDDGDFPPEPTGEQIFGHGHRAAKLTDGTRRVYLNGETRPIAKMTEIPDGGWSLIHNQAGYLGKFRDELQVFDALDLH